MLYLGSVIHHHYSLSITIKIVIIKYGNNVMKITCEQVFFKTTTEILK